MYKFIDFFYFINKTEKNYRTIAKKLIFCQICMEFDGCHGNIKTEIETISMSKYLQRINEQLLKVLSP